MLLYLLAFSSLSLSPSLFPSAFVMLCVRAGRLPPRATDTVHYLHAHTNRATRGRKLRHCACSSGQPCVSAAACLPPERPSTLGPFQPALCAPVCSAPCPSARGAKFLQPRGKRRAAGPTCLRAGLMAGLISCAFPKGADEGQVERNCGFSLCS